MVPSSPPVIHSDSRQQLQNDLLLAVKQCQIRFGGKTELATEYDLYVSKICNCLESILSHGLKPKTVIKKNNSAIKLVTERVLGVNGSEQLVFWNYVREHLTKHERDRYEQLRHIWTDNGRGRAWLRSALNERSLERYLLSLLETNSAQIHTFYESWAFLLDQERSNVLPQAAAGLASILFAISIDRPELNEGGGGLVHIQQEPVIPVPETIPDVKKKNDGKRRKRVPTNIISFDGDYDEASSSLSTSPHHPVTTPVVTLEPVIVVGEEFVADLDSGVSDHDVSTESDAPADVETGKGLRPISNSNIGELIPVPLTEETQTSEDSLSVPSVTEEVECASVGGSSVEAVEACCEAIAEEGSSHNDIVNLRHELDKVKEYCQVLKMQYSQSTKSFQEKNTANESRIQALNRENDLLKHQLRKYVSAVQMLKQEGQCEETELYEKKLVQVAEMHGELMELNDRLQRTLLGKEGSIRRLKTELETLRGPLIESDEEDSLGPALVSLWIPSVFLAGNNSPHHVYQVHVRICDDEWNVYRRYAQFYGLHKHLKQQYQVIATFNFPPKKTIGNKDAKFVEDRRQKLQYYLRRVMNHLVASHTALSTAPSKPLLISLIPFFGDQVLSSERRRNSPNNLLSRNAPAESPQYTGL